MCGMIAYQATISGANLILPRAIQDRKSTRLKLQSLTNLVCRLLLEKKKKYISTCVDLQFTLRHTPLIVEVTRCHVVGGPRVVYIDFRRHKEDDRSSKGLISMVWIS